MNLISILKLVLSLASSISEYFRERKLMEAGEIKAKAEALEHAEEEISKAEEARNSAVGKFDNDNGLPDEADPNLRD